MHLAESDSDRSNAAGYKKTGKRESCSSFARPRQSGEMGLKVLMLFSLREFSLIHLSSPFLIRILKFSCDTDRAVSLLALKIRIYWLINMMFSSRSQWEFWQPSTVSLTSYSKHWYAITDAFP